jgi:hypothetical protein
MLPLQNYYTFKASNYNTHKTKQYKTKVNNTHKTKQYTQIQQKFPMTPSGIEPATSDL